MPRRLWATLRKAVRILRERGPRVLAARAFARVARDVRSAARSVRRKHRWKSTIRARSTPKPVCFPEVREPRVCIAIFALGDPGWTSACLNAIAGNADPSIATEIIVFDDGSDPRVATYLSRCSNLTAIPTGGTSGIAAAVNEAIARTVAPYVHFLTNDTIVAAGWLAPLLETFETRTAAGAVGSRLTLPDGSLLEAGSVLWSDGRASNYAPVDTDGARFVREVDYCSVSSLMVERAAFLAVGGFDRSFEPWCYGDVDLCVRLRSAGRPVYYQPGSAAAHAGRLPPHSTVAPAQSEARERFAATWRNELPRYESPDPARIERAARRLQGDRTLLVMDTLVPAAERDAGSHRLVEIMSIAQGLGWHVIFVPHESGAQAQAASTLRQQGIEVRTHRGDAFDALMALPVAVDLAWISRPHLCDRYLPFIQSRMHVPVIYDTVDLHHVRLRREEHVSGKRTPWSSTRDLELRLAGEAELTVVTSFVEAVLLREAGLRAHVIPVMANMYRGRRSPDGRSGILFLGNYTHAPNVDAVQWLCEEIMPLVWSRVPELHLTLAGFDPVPAVLRLASSRVTVSGFAASIEPAFALARAFVAPLRFGAGLKGKLVQSLAHGLPLVTTSIGAEGIDLRDGHDALIADDASTFADGIVRLYEDAELWERLSQGGIETAERFTPSAVRPQLGHILDLASRSGEG